MERVRELIHRISAQQAAQESPEALLFTARALAAELEALVPKPVLATSKNVVVLLPQGHVSRGAAESHPPAPSRREGERQPVNISEGEGERQPVNILEGERERQPVNISGGEGGRQPMNILEGEGERQPVNIPGREGGRQPVNISEGEGEKSQPMNISEGEGEHSLPQENSRNEGEQSRPVSDAPKEEVSLEFENELADSRPEELQTPNSKPQTSAPEPSEPYHLKPPVQTSFFNPIEDVPTLAQQTPLAEPAKEVFELHTPGESLHDRLRRDESEVAQKHSDAPIRDLRKGIALNDRYLFVSELFRGDEAMYERSIKTINAFHILPEAEYWINRELKVKLAWDDSMHTVQHFYGLVRRRFS